jgi:SAM-dependent methyltransferase
MLTIENQLISGQPTADEVTSMNTFMREDGRAVPVVEGFRQFLLSYRPPVTPKAEWTREQYAAAAVKKRHRAARLVESFRHWLGPLEDVALLDVGCGDGSNCLVLGEEPLRRVVGVDLELPLFAADEKGNRTRNLAADIQAKAAVAANSHPVHFLRMDATRLGFEDGTFDVLMSRSAMEHIRPIEPALREMARVVRPGGLIYLGIDPFYWLRGCHKRGVVDIPWAHARLTLAEYRRFVLATEGEKAAERRSRRLETLNRFTVRQWRQLIDQMDCEVLAFAERPSTLGEQILAEHPEVLETLLPEVTQQDLLCERIEVWLRKK